MRVALLKRGLGRKRNQRQFVLPDEGAMYDGGVHEINLDLIRPMVAHPGTQTEGIPSDHKRAY